MIYTLGFLPNPVMSVGAYGASPEDGIGFFSHDLSTGYMGWIGAIRTGPESGGWGSKVADWKHFRNACGPYTGPRLEYLTAACTMPDGSHWAVQEWVRIKPNFGGRRGDRELRVSHWRGPTTVSRGVSRSAVLGKARRLRLHRRDDAATHPSISAARHGAPTGSDRALAEKAFAERVRHEAQLRREPIAPEIPSPQTRPCTFMELTRETCRWPVGDPAAADFHFCGAPPDGSHVYCPHHRHIAHARDEDGDACP